MERKLRDVITAALDASNRKRVKTSDLLEAARMLFKNGGYSDFEINDRICAALEKLEKEELVKLPSRAGSKWDKITGLPEYVTIAGKESEEREKQKQSRLRAMKYDTGWEPSRMAAFAHSLRGKKQLEKALAVNRYLKNQGKERPIVPHRERALQIFGDEKALDSHVESGLFGGRIRLEHLDCFHCPEPLPYEPLSMDTRRTKGKPLLVVENSCTYWSCCRANEIVGIFAAVVYGQGFKVASVKRIVEGLPAVEEKLEAEGTIYFGDLDPAGLEIARKIHRHREKNGLSLLIPAIPLYKALIQKGVKTEYGRSQKKYHLRQWALEWLGEEVGTQYLKCAQTRRWPQEGLSTADIVEALAVTKL